ncbi:MAG TPA: class I SAM-dependent methyltransferase [Candidatus Binatia bacterium]
MSRRRPAGARGERSSAYWNDVASGSEQGAPPLWRLHADRATLALLEGWWPAGRCARVLKTDLYDESRTRGLVPALAERADVVVGIDVSTVVARRAAAGGPVLVVTSDVRALPFGAGAFDVVMSNSTLDHFRAKGEIGRALRELERVLAADGSLLLTLDNPRHPLLALRTMLAPIWRRLGLVPYPLGATYGARELREALVASGFTVEALTAVHHFPRIALVAAQRLLPVALGERLLRIADRAERCGAWPTRFVTGQYVAALARPTRGCASQQATDRHAAA